VGYSFLKVKQKVSPIFISGGKSAKENNMLNIVMTTAANLVLPIQHRTLAFEHAEEIISKCNLDEVPLRFFVEGMFEVGITTENLIFAELLKKAGMQAVQDEHGNDIIR
jgi:hypothetical protein